MSQAISILLGAGGHASVLVDILRQQGKTPDYLVTLHAPEKPIFDGIKILRQDSQVLNFAPDQVHLINGLGSLPKTPPRRRQIFEYFKQHGYQFASVIADQAYISPYAVLGEGVQVLGHACVQPSTYIGNNTLINTGASLDHDCQIGQHVHIAPRATLCGEVKVADNVHVGSGSTLIQGVHIGENAIIAAGTTVTQHLEADRLVRMHKSSVINILL